jgi:hypothetical protein
MRGQTHALMVCPQAAGKGVLCRIPSLAGVLLASHVINVASDSQRMAFSAHAPGMWPPMALCSCNDCRCIDGWGEQVSEHDGTRFSLRNVVEADGLVSAVTPGLMYTLNRCVFTVPRLMNRRVPTSTLLSGCGDRRRV